jgi:hypothetical protein
MTQRMNQLKMCIFFYFTDKEVTHIFEVLNSIIDETFDSQSEEILKEEQKSIEENKDQSFNDEEEDKEEE